MPASSRRGSPSQDRAVASAATAAPVADSTAPGGPSIVHQRAIRLPDRLSCSPPFARHSGCSTAVRSRCCRSTRVPTVDHRKSPGPIRAPRGLEPPLRRQLGDAQDGWRRGVSRSKAGAFGHGGRRGPRPRRGRRGCPCGCRPLKWECVAAQDGPHDHDAGPNDKPGAVLIMSRGNAHALGGERPSSGPRRNRRRGLS
jgi:hypothetical protein